MKNTLNEITDTVIESLLAPLKEIAAMNSLTHSDDPDDVAVLLAERLDEAIKLANQAITETTKLRELYDRVK